MGVTSCFLKEVRVLGECAAQLFPDAPDHKGGPFDCPQRHIAGRQPGIANEIPQPSVLKLSSTVS
jgi:hypothetical protein